MPFIPDKSVEHLRPADYNPRAITPQAARVPQTAESR